MKNLKKLLSALPTIEGVVIAVLGAYSLTILTPQINYWKDRCSSLQHELNAKTSEFQAFLDFYVKKIEALEKENASLKKNNARLAKKLEDIQGLASSEGKERLQNELAGVKQSLETLSGKLQNQTEKISEAKTSLKTAETYFTSSPSARNFPGEIIYKDGRSQGFEWMGSEFGSDYVYYSMSIENTSQHDTIPLGEIARIDFLDITEAEKAKDIYRTWPIKSKITFKDGTSWDNIYLFSNSWKYKTKHSEGLIISRLRDVYSDGYLTMESIIFKK